MARIKFTQALNRFFPDLKDMEIAGTTVQEVLQKVEAVHPGINNYLLDEQGVVRPHMNIFLKGELIEDRETLQDKVQPEDEILIFQALSGG